MLAADRRGCVVRWAWSAAGLIAFAAVALATARAVRLAMARGQDDVGRKPSILYEVPAGGAMDLILPADVETVRLHTHTFAPAGFDGNPVQWLDYPVRVRWIDDAGQTVLDRIFVERTRVSWFPDPGGERPVPATHLLHDDRLVTDCRTTLAPGRAVLPDGGSLRVSGGDGGLLVRPFGSVANEGLGVALGGLTATRRLRTGWTRRIGLPDWSMLDLGERRGVAATSWRFLHPTGRTGAGRMARWIVGSDLTLSALHQRAAGFDLPAGRSVALDLVGPVSVRISGGDDVAFLRHHVVWGDRPDPDRAALSPGVPLGIPGESRAVRYTLALEGPVSLHLHNPTGRDLGPILASIDRPDPQALAGWSVGALLEDLEPTGRGGDTTLLGPVWRVLGGWHASRERRVVFPVEWVEYGAPVKIVVRPVLSGPSDLAPRSLDVEALAGDGGVTWRSRTVVPAVPSRYEAMLPGRGWIGEASVVYVPRDPGVRRLSVGADGDVVVVARSRGAPFGGESLDPLPSDPDVVLRFRHPRPTDWHPIPPEGGEVPWIRYVANARMERRGATDDDLDGIPELGAGIPIHWRSLEPSDPEAAGRTWLVPPREGTTPGLLYCGHAPGEGPRPLAWSPDAARALEGRLKGVLWTSGTPSLGNAFSVELDGAPWRRGTIRQRVTRLSGAGERPRDRISFQGPPGSTLWVRTWDRPGSACETARRALVAWPVDPGARIGFHVRREWSGQLVSIGGFASGESRLRILIDGGEVRRRTGLLEAFSDGDREWILPLGVEQSSLLDDPDAGATALEARALALGEDLLDDAHRVEVMNRSAGRVWIRAAIQSTRAPEPVRVEVPGMVPAGGEE